MIRLSVVVSVVLAAGVAWTGSAAAGWFIEQAEKGGDPGAGREQSMIQANRVKTVLLRPDGTPQAGMIVDLNAQTITQVDYGARAYTTFTVQEFVQQMRGINARMLQQMQEQLKDLPPEQRKMMEQMMRSQPAQDCREPRIEVRRTGQQASIAGYPAVRHDVIADGKLGSELWITRGITAWRELDPAKVERFVAEIARLGDCGSAQGKGGLAWAGPAWQAANEGFPVRTVYRTGNGRTVEVVTAESRNIPTTEFQPPAGFARRSLRQMFGE